MRPALDARGNHALIDPNERLVAGGFENLPKNRFTLAACSEG